MWCMVIDPIVNTVNMTLMWRRVMRCIIAGNATKSMVIMAWIIYSDHSHFKLINQIKHPEYLMGSITLHQHQNMFKNHIHYYSSPFRWIFLYFSFNLSKYLYFLVLKVKICMVWLNTITYQYIANILALHAIWTLSFFFATKMVCRATLDARPCYTIWHFLIRRISSKNGDSIWRRSSLEGILSYWFNIALKKRQIVFSASQKKITQCTYV